MLHRSHATYRCRTSCDAKGCGGGGSDQGRCHNEPVQGPQSSCWVLCQSIPWVCWSKACMLQPQAADAPHQHGQRQGRLHGAAHHTGPVGLQYCSRPCLQSSHLAGRGNGGRASEGRSRCEACRAGHGSKMEGASASMSRSASKTAVGTEAQPGPKCAHSSAASAPLLQRSPAAAAHHACHRCAVANLELAHGGADLGGGSRGSDNWDQRVSTVGQVGQQSRRGGCGVGTLGMQGHAGPRCQHCPAMPCLCDNAHNLVACSSSGEHCEQLAMGAGSICTAARSMAGGGWGPLLQYGICSRHGRALASTSSTLTWDARVACCLSPLVSDLVQVCKGGRRQGDMRRTKGGWHSSGRGGR